jgi:hypothetical protein
MVVDFDLGIAGKLASWLQILLGRRDATAMANPCGLLTFAPARIPLGQVLLAVIFLLGEDLLAECRLDLLALGAPMRTQA